ncbi:MAG: HpcH/HpaI aldolase family protein [Alphaproteobacteria bacterium]
MKENKLKRKLQSGEIVIGSFVTIASGTLAEMVGLVGFDFAVIDMEHGSIETTVAEDMVRAVELAGATPIIRVTHNTPSLILRALDIGAQALHVPDVNTVQQAEAAVKSSKYGPEGHRGLAGVRAAEYGLTQSLPEYAAHANRETMIIAHIEDIEAVNNLDDLLNVDGIDIYYLGPQDLSNSLGIPGQANDPRVVELVEDSIRRIAAAGKVAGCIAVDGKAAKRYVDLGARYMATHVVRFMADGSRRFMQEVRS